MRNMYFCAKLKWITMRFFPRLNEYKLLLFRILLAYFFYFLVRLLFYFYNYDLIKIDGFFDFAALCYHGIAFDTTSILYLNALFIFFSLFPLVINSKIGYQKFLFWVYFIPNLLGFALNFVDFIYYKYTFSRTTIAVLDSLKDESNKALLFKNFLINYWHVFLLFFSFAYLWIYIYKKIKISNQNHNPTFIYFSSSIVGLLLVATLSVGGIRGDFQKSTRPINILDASRHVKNSGQADVVLNTPFAFIRTLFSNSFKKINLVDKATIDSLVIPVKEYHNNPKTKPNIVILILESNGKEYYGCLNKNTNIPDFVSYTPFVDSLAQHSLIFTNAYSNGYKSIHAVSSIFAGIPSFKDAFTSSPYPKQKTESLVSVLKSDGYNTSFFHGAPNGSMGFLGYTNILGIDNYYGKTEYNNDDDFDGSWGIWDEPFMQFFDKTINTKKQPFMATLFSVTSHEPYVIPEKYKNKFPEGPIIMHKCIRYTDYAMQQFFNKAKTQPWFKNTIFVLVGDHGNLIHYDEYQKEFNHNTIAMLIYSPNGKYVGVNNDFAQQIDIYPTLLDMMGYQKPFRSWGRSLVSKSNLPPFVMRYSPDIYQYYSGNYFCTFDGTKAVGFYDKNDKAMTKNLIANRNPEMNLIELRCKAFLQDYMERVIDKKLDK